MKISTLKKDKRVDSRNDRYLNVQTYGDNNDYPQQVMQIVEASGTGKSCLDVYAKFIGGKGFTDNDFYRKTLNRKGQTADYILDQIKNDYAEFGGFALHVNYNANYQIIEIQHIPFEHIRFERTNEDGEFNKLAIHPDWGRQFTQIRKFRKEDIEFINFFNSDPEVIEQQVADAGGWSLYKGQVFYFSKSGEKTYPTPIFDPVLTDMNTEEGIANVNNRNVRNNFLPSGMLINKVQDNNSAADNDFTDDGSAIESALKEFQGDENAGKILYVEIENEEEKPEFSAFKGTNYDKEFTVTRDSVQDNIGKSFMQPPILRSEDVGANFGADLMKNAYDFYNSITENERLNIERVFTQIFKNWYEATSGDYSIIPLSYDVEMTIAERLGDNFDKLLDILNDTGITQELKRRRLRRVFNLTDEEINDLI